jgi:hypothetical protein
MRLVGNLLANDSPASAARTGHTFTLVTRYSPFAGPVCFCLMATELTLTLAQACVAITKAIT